MECKGLIRKEVSIQKINVLVLSFFLKDFGLGSLMLQVKRTHSVES